MHGQNYILDSLHILCHFIVQSPLMSFDGRKLVDNLKLQNPKLFLV